MLDDRRCHEGGGLIPSNAIITLSKCLRAILDTVTLEEEEKEKEDEEKSLSLMNKESPFSPPLNNNTPEKGIKILMRIMILACTYHDANEVYLTQHIRAHSIWRSQHIWEAMLEEGLKNTLKNEVSWDDAPPDMRHDEVVTVNSAIFNQLAIILLNQVEFGIPIEEIERFLHEKCTKSNLGEQQASNSL